MLAKLASEHWLKPCVHSLGECAENRVDLGMKIHTIKNHPRDPKGNKIDFVKILVPRQCFRYLIIFVCIYIYTIIKESLEVKLSTIWTDEKQSWEESEKRREEKEDQRRKSQKKEDPGARKVGKSRNETLSFSDDLWLQRGSKSGLGKAAGAEPSGQRDEKLHTVVARSTFRSQNVQNTSVSDHFWKLRCRKSVRRCGTKHISKSKCTKDPSVGSLLEGDMSNKCTPLWREAHVQVKMHKENHSRTTFGS